MIKSNKIDKKKETKSRVFSRTKGKVLSATTNDKNC